MTARRLLLVTWEDIWTHPEAGWKPIDQVEKMAACIARSVGWEMRRTKKYLILASHIMEDQADGEVRIPLGAILKEQDLKP